MPEDERPPTAPVPSPRPVSVIVRVHDQAQALGTCLTLLRAQDLPAEVIVVDHASSDGSADVARAHGATVLAIAADAFSFGGALNLGAAHARGELLVALSADAFPRDQTWLRRLSAPFADERVACACGERFAPDGTQLAGPTTVDAASIARHPTFGYSNGAGAFRAALWRERPFREDLPGCEDKEWAAYWAGADRDRVCVLDPALLVDHDHTHDPLRAIFRRARREAAAMGIIWPGLGGPGKAGSLISEWWVDTRFYSSPWRARLSHRRAARLLGAWAGFRDAASVRTGRDRPGAAPG